MIGTLNFSSKPILRFSPGNRSYVAGNSRSDGRIIFAGQNRCKSAVYAAVAETVRHGGGSLYEVLRVRRNASTTEIKTAYRNLAKMYHPDASRSAESGDGDFIEIQDAYATLSDPTARAMYDLSLNVERRSFDYGGGGGIYPTRRWETDQCW